MKTFRLIGMALLAVVMSINFTSCSDDDEEPIKNDDGVITNQKRLMEIKKTNAEGSLEIYTFSYDSKGRLTSVTDSWNGKEYTTRFTWGNNTIMGDGDSGESTYFLNNNNLVSSFNTIIQRINNSNPENTYNSSNQLINTSISRCTATYTWNNDRITKCFVEDKFSYNQYWEYTYSGKTCKGYFPLYTYNLFGDDYIFFAHPELIGMRTNQLPEQILIKGTDKGEYDDDYYQETCKSEYTYEDKFEFDYTLNKDGYLESCTIIHTDVNIIKQSFADKNGDGVITDNERNVTETDIDTTIVNYSFKWE